jgi:hypothetical protein
MFLHFWFLIFIHSKHKSAHIPKFLSVRPCPLVLFVFDLLAFRVWYTLGSEVRHRILSITPTEWNRVPNATSGWRRGSWEAESLSMLTWHGISISILNGPLRRVLHSETLEGLNFPSGLLRNSRTYHRRSKWQKTCREFGEHFWEIRNFELKIVASLFLIISYI